MSEQYTLKNILASLAAGRRVEAQALIAYCIENHVRLGSDWLQVAALAIRIGELQLARHAADEFYRQAKKDADTDTRYAGLYAESGDLIKALEIIAPYIEQKSTLPSVYHMAGTIKAQLGELAQARLLLIQAISLAPHLGITWFTLASIVDFKQYPGLLERLELVCREINTADKLNSHYLCYALAKAKDDCGDYQDAWKLYERGAAIVQSLKPASLNDDQALISKLINNFSHDVVAQLPRSRTQELDVIAILGLPRSGTTLLGQMLGCHTKVRGAGEMNAIAAACMHLKDENFYNFPSFIKTHGHPIAALEHIAAVYQDVAAQYFNGTGYIVDKSLNLNRCFGVFAQALPQAKAIYIRRNDEDTAWSCFRNHFRNTADWSWQPRTIASYITQERRLLAHWQTVYSERILEISYESLVANPEQVLTDVCQFLGWQYEPKMLEFHRSRAPVLTSSVGQVHQPLHPQRLDSARNYPVFLSELSA